ncbi:MAG TPA: tRNA (adenosine(37)-N6)-threonylcarbamoyltransferase complex transferase subunit TsaD [Spirochaetia bacterium]|nr:tRNA (adenosine(37)-N6)-threonylcarbamoyltransferase complex transferase subunit TsaD [Spirochaetia bacterium]
MKVLAIESTCDETAAAVVESCGAGVKILNNVVASSVLMHQKYGGIVPEVAAREQIKSMVPVIMEAVGKDRDSIQAIAVSFGPGLMGSLLVGVESAKSLAWAWKKPLYSVNHMAAHVFANWIVESMTTEVPRFPAVSLVVSGGHTDLVLMKNTKDWEWIGGTRDDAVGEAFDKTARLLGLPYPGGPEISKAVERVTEEMRDKYGSKFKLPRPLLNENNLDMSFSGLKAAIAKIVNGLGEIDEEIRDMLAWEFSEAVIEILIKKTMKAVERYKPKSVLMAGGVAANKQLREGLKVEVEKNEDIKFFCPELKYCGDNAAMVGVAAVIAPNEVKPVELKPDPSVTTV